jgi:hypothetical protein
MTEQLTRIDQVNLEFLLNPMRVTWVSAERSSSKVF